MKLSRLSCFAAVVAAAALLCGASVSAAATAHIAGPNVQGSYVATVLAPTTAYTQPGGHVVVTQLATHALFYGGANSLMVLASAVVGGHEYLDVRLPERPDLLSGWVSANAMLVAADPYRIQISTAQRSAEILKNGHVIDHTLAVVGAVGTPTPTGLFAISETVPQPAGSVDGPYVVALTAHSNVYQSFGGGDGTIGIHSYELLGAPLGTRSSHGCVRVPTAFVDQVLKLPEGTPVVIS